MPDTDVKTAEQILRERGLAFDEDKNEIVERLRSEVPSTEPPPPDAPPDQASEPEPEPASEPEAEPEPEVRDHYVIATTPDGRRVPTWDSRHGRDEFTRAEAEESTIHYAGKMRRAGVTGPQEIRYEPVGIEAYHLALNPPRDAGPEEKKLVHADVTFAEDAHLAGGDGSGAVPLPPEPLVSDVDPEDSALVEDEDQS